MSIIDFLIGRPIATSDERAEQIGIAKGIPIFGLDALSSAAYGPEAALTLLIPLGLAGLTYIVPLSLSIIALLVIVFFSYLQTISAYPGGGGSYTVAHENLGTFPGLVAASALMIDYVLTAAVGISAGIGALTSAVPSLYPHTLALCLVALALITLVNLRGVGEAGGVFMVPTYLFLACMLLAVGIGVVKSILSGGHPVPVHAPPHAAAATASVSAWLLLKAFASGCTAMTGVEAVSNGVKAFKEPAAKHAQRTLAIIIAALVVMLAGIAYLAHAYGIAATEPGSAHYESVLSMLFVAISGRGAFYFVAIGSVLLVLVFSANTAFADFPRVCRVIADDRFLPVSFSNRGRRLVFTEGIWVLAILSGLLLIVFGGITDRLIPLYAVGAFLAFTLSQAGMVAHWRKKGGANAHRNILVNGLGALATGATVLVVVVAKFVEGAWITVAALPALLFLMYGVRRHYEKLQLQIDCSTPLDTTELYEPVVVIPIQHWSKVSQKGLRTALQLSTQVKVLHVAEEDKPDEFCGKWNYYVVDPARKANLPIPELVVLKSPYRFVIAPIVDYVLLLSHQHPERRVITIVPELLEHRWYNYFLHAQRATLLKTQLLVKGNDRVSVLNIPWYFR